MTEPIIKEIGSILDEYYTRDSESEVFIPGESKINYAGRVFDHQEVLSLIDASLEFWLTAGRYTEKFESIIGQYTGTSKNLMVNSGSSANLLAFQTLTSPYLQEEVRIHRKDEVITTAMCFPTTVSPILQYGAVPVFVDVNLRDGNIDASKIRKAITDKTKAISIAHTLGVPFDICEIEKICKEHNLWLLEDNCDALGSQYLSRTTGSIGDISTCSFYPAHHITTGEGGMVCTNNPQLYKIAKSLRDWGRDCSCDPGEDNKCHKRFEGQHGTLPKGYDHKYVYSHMGFNLKATDLQAAIGCAQLEKMEMFIDLRKSNHSVLMELLKDRVEEYIWLPRARNGCFPSWFGFLMVMRYSDGVLKDVSRNGLANFLESRNIQTRNLFAGNIVRHPCFSSLREGEDYIISGNLRNTDRIMNDALWIGVYPGMSREMLEFMRKSIIEYLKV